MKIIFTLCFAAVCLTTHGQPAKPLVPRDVYAHYLAMGTNIVGLKAKKLALDEAFLAEDKKIKMQYDARQLNNDQRGQMIDASTKAYSAKSNDVKTQIATLELKRLEIERKYKMPVVATDKPKPAKKTKPTPASVSP